MKPSDDLQQTALVKNREQIPNFIMNIKKTMTKLVSALLIPFGCASTIALSANSANAEWKVMGKSNGGSEIAFSTNEVSVEAGIRETSFVYRIKTKEKTSMYTGLVDCLKISPSYWAVSTGVVEADSKASKAMLSKVCQIAIAKSRQDGVAAGILAPTKSEQRVTVLPQSLESGLSIIGSCTASGTIADKLSENINCSTVKITGLKDKRTYIYYHFINDFGNGFVFVTERFNAYSPGSAKILAVGKEVDGDLRLSSVVINPVNTCEVKAQQDRKTKVSCYYSSEDGTVVGNIEGYSF